MLESNRDIHAESSDMDLGPRDQNSGACEGDKLEFVRHFR